CCWLCCVPPPALRALIPWKRSGRTDGWRIRRHRLSVSASDKRSFGDLRTSILGWSLDAVDHEMFPRNPDPEKYPDAIGRQYFFLSSIGQASLKNAKKTRGQ